MRLLFTCLIGLVLHGTILGQASLLQSGPMLGYSEMREVLLWVQTKEAAEVHFEYWDKEIPEKKYQTASVRTAHEEAYTAKVKAELLEPGRKYGYQLFINDQKVVLSYPTEFQTQALWQWRTDPPDFTLAVGSCTYVNEPKYDRPGSPYGGDYEIFEAIHRERPDAMLWLGDNVYLREVDWHSRSGIVHRYTHTRSLEEMQPLLASTHHYAIWDDHDFGPNNADRSFFYKNTALEIFTLFWGNPGFGVNGQPGVTSYFQWADMEFFLLDNRYFRSPNDRKIGQPTFLGEEQIEWLIDALTSSRAPFKLVGIGGQVLNTVENYETYSNLAPEERAYLLKRIEEENIKNVIFLTGDRHHSELSHFVNAAGNHVYDLTISPLTAGAGSNPEVGNELRVEGTLVNQRNYGLLKFSGPREQRKLGIQVMDVKGEEIWSREIVVQE